MEPLVRMTLSLLVGVKQKEGAFLAICPFLNVVSRGNTREKAVQNLKEVVEFLFETCFADGSLGAVLDHRTLLRSQLPPLEDLVSLERTYVDLPLQISPELLRRFTDAAASA